MIFSSKLKFTLCCFSEIFALVNQFYGVGGECNKSTTGLKGLKKQKSLLRKES